MHYKGVYKVSNNFMCADIDKNKDCGSLIKFITWTVLLFTPLSTYITYIKEITFGDVLLIISILLIMINILKYNLNLSSIVASPLLLYIMFIIFHSLIFWMVSPHELSEGILGVLRYLLYLFATMIGARYFFNYQYGYKIYKKLAVLFALYCIVQFFSYNFFSVVLPSNLFGLPTVDYINAITSEYNMNMYLSGTVLYRPRSIFLEPSYYAAYQIPILYLILNNENEKFLVRYGVSLLITISIFLAGTTTGILLQFLCWWKPVTTELRKLSYRFIIFLIIVIPCVLHFIDSDYWQRVLNRIISSDKTLGASVTGRTQNYQILFDGSLSWNQLLFGQGKWADVGYLPSYGTLILSFGLIGLMLFLAAMLWTYLKTQKRGRAMIVLLLIMCTGTNTLFNISSVLMLFLIYSNYK